MTESTDLQLTKRAVLDDTEFADVRALVERCQAAEGETRVIWDALQASDDGLPNQLLVRDAGRLVGYLRIEGLGEDEAEAAAHVDPQATTAPIAAQLLGAAADTCRARGSATLIVALDRRAAALADAIAAQGASLHFSEHKLRRDSTGTLALPASDLQVAQAGPADAGEIAQILASDMGADPAGFAQYIASNLQRPNYRYYIARHAGAPAGTGNVQQLNGDFYIYGLVVRPEYRGRGYGRQLMLHMLADLAARGPEPMYIEVESENTPAWTLYRSLGFELVATFDYYRLDV